MVPQMLGFITSSRIWGVNLFVDHATDFCYGHLMRSLDLEETLLAKKAFEKFARVFYTQTSIIFALT